MRSQKNAVLAMVAVVLLLCLPGCLLEEKIVEVVLTGETCAEFPEDHETEQYTTPVVVDYATRISEILADNDLDRSDIAMARVVSASYQVTDFDHSHDWTISGYIEVERVGSVDADTILNYTNQSLLGAQAEPIVASLHTEGVNIVDQALEDYLNGQSPMLRFSVNNGSVDPAPSELDPLVFTWEACIRIHIVYQEDLEVPDPL
jgi:hypothetical protein